MAPYEFQEHACLWSLPLTSSNKQQEKATETQGDTSKEVSPTDVKGRLSSSPNLKGCQSPKYYYLGDQAYTMWTFMVTFPDIWKMEKF